LSDAERTIAVSDVDAERFRDEFGVARVRVVENGVDTQHFQPSAAPPDPLRRHIAKLPGVELFGNVPDVRPFLATCGMLVVPLRIGGGSRLKILEALASGTPVVSTLVGAEGRNLAPGLHFEQVDDVSQMSDAIVQAIRHPARARRQAESGRR